MAETAIGVLGLAGLFNNAIDWFEYIHIAKRCAPRLQTHILKIDNAALRLSRWGGAFGLSDVEDDETLRYSALFSLNNDQEKLAEETFKNILKKFADCKEVCDNYWKDHREEEIKPFSSQHDDSLRRYLHQKMCDISFRRRNKISTYRKAVFAIYDEKHLIALINDINILIDHLYKLFPPPEHVQAQLSREELERLLEVLRILESTVNSSDPTLASAVHYILDQKNDMRIENKHNVVQWQGVKSGGTDTQHVGRSSITGTP